MTIRRLLFTLLLAVSAASMSANGGAPPHDNKGTDFVLAFPQNVSMPPHVSHRLTLFMAADRPTRVEISGPEVVTAFFDIPQSTVLEVFFDTTALQLTPGGVSNKGIRVRSIDPWNPDQEGFPIAVFGLNRRQTTAGAFVALPVNVLGTQYRALTQVGTAIGPGSQVTIVGSEDDTVVWITTPVDVPGLTTAGVAHQVVLNRLQTFLVQLQVGDLTGTIVTADKPVAVFSGSHNSAVGGGSPDHMIEQMIPVSAWGDQFVVAPIATTPPRTMGDLVRVLAHENETAVELDGVPKVVLGAGQFYEFVQPSTAGSSIQTSKPALVAQYNRGDLLQTSPFVMLVPPVREFGLQYLFKTPRFTALGENHWLSIVVRDGDEAGLLLNGAALPSGVAWTSVNGYRYARVTIPAGAGQRLEHQEPTVQFGAWVYGHASGEGYGYAAGQLVEDTTSPEFRSIVEDQTVEAATPNGAAVTWTDPTATDFGRGAVGVRCDPPAGHVFPLGRTTVTCRTTDPAGNTTTASFEVTVVDTTPPRLTVPADITVRPASPQGTALRLASAPGTVVTFEVTATDLVDPSVSVVCDPPSGSVFAPGTTTIVTCTATDVSGNSSKAAFTVTVINHAPICSAAVPSARLLWPPHHDLVPITIRGVTDPDGDRVSIHIDSVFQDEPTNSTGDGNAGIDGFGLGPIAMVRAERNARGDGRVYHIGFTATDAYDASCTGTVNVGVPRTPNFAPVDNGAIYDSSAQLQSWLKRVPFQLIQRLLSMR